MKNNSCIYKIWEIIKPFIIYYILYSVVFILNISLCQAIAQGLGNEYQTYLAEYTETVTGLVSGLSMVISVLPLIPMLRGELKEHKRSVYGTVHESSTVTRDRDNANIEQRTMSMSAEKYNKDKKCRVLSLFLTIIFATTSSLGLNILLALTGIVGTSASYQDVAKQQYGVVFGVGMLLFGLISPITEEIVFRGLIFNRMRRYLPHATAVIVSGVLFGIYHGNLVQGLYGGCMGILMAYLYERMHSFFIPCLFHATANFMVYMIAQNAALHGQIFTLPGCVTLLIVSAVCIVIVEFWGQKVKHTKKGY